MEAAGNGNGQAGGSAAAGPNNPVRRNEGKCHGCGSTSHRVYEFKDGKPVCPNYDASKANKQHKARAQQPFGRA